MDYLELLGYVIVGVLSLGPEVLGQCVCPGPGDPPNYTVCSRRTRNGVTTYSCMDPALLGGILGGVFGFLTLVGITITITICVLLKKGIVRCVPYQRGNQRRYRLERVKKDQAQTADMNQSGQLSGEAGFTSPSGVNYGFVPPQQSSPMEMNKY